MLYEKDIYGNVIGTGGDDTSLQNEKMAGYPGYNLFDKQRDAAVLTQGEIEGKTGVNLGGNAAGNGTAVATSSPASGVALSRYINGEQLAPADYVALDKLSGGGRPKVLGADRNDEELLRARAGLPPLETAGDAASTTIPRYTPITSTEQLAAAMGYTSPQEEKRLRKASVTNQRILAIGDALRHIGNIANTVRYAPSQQFNSPVLEEEKRYEKGKALRDAANARYISYKQAKERQDAAQRQWETQFKYNMAKDAANFELKKNESEAKQQRQKALAELDKARLEGQIDKNTYQRLVNKFYPETAQAKITEIESRVAKNNRTNVGGRSSGGGKGKGLKVKGYFYDKDGNIHYYTTNTDLDSKLQEYAPEIPKEESYVKGKNAFGKDVTGTRKSSSGTRAGEANARYRPKQNASSGKGKTNVNKGKTPSKGSQGSKGGSGKTQSKTTAKGKGQKVKSKRQL